VRRGTWHKVIENRYEKDNRGDHASPRSDIHSKGGERQEKIARYTLNHSQNVHSTRDHAALPRWRQTLLTRHVESGDAAVRHGIARDLQHAPHAAGHNAGVPHRVLFDELERFARAFIVTANAVGPL